jgi:hypothetical protein
MKIFLNLLLCTRKIPEKKVQFLFQNQQTFNEFGQLVFYNKLCEVVDPIFTLLVDQLIIFCKILYCKVL